MLPPGFISYLLFNFVKKHSNGKHIILKFFLFSGLCWGMIGLIGILLILSLATSASAEPSTKLSLLFLVPTIFFVLGELYAFICWLIWLRKEEL